MQNDQNTAPAAAPKKKSRKLLALATGTALIAGGAFGVHAFANSKTYSHMYLAASDGGWHSAPRHRRHGGSERMSEADMERKVTRMVRHAAIEIDATPEQEEKITALAKTLAKDLMPLRGEMREMRDELQSLLMAETIDVNAIEAMRADRVAEMDRISKTVTAAVVDVAEILTPEQREALNERIGQFKSHRRGKRRHGGWKH